MEYAKQQLHLVFLGFIVASLLSMHSGDLIYELPFFKLVL